MIVNTLGCFAANLHPAASSGQPCGVERVARGVEQAAPQRRMGGPAASDARPRSVGSAAPQRRACIRRTSGDVTSLASRCASGIEPGT